MPIIAMSREIGSDDEAVARGVAERLGLDLHPGGTDRDLPLLRCGNGRLAGIGSRRRARADTNGLLHGYLSPEEVLALALRGSVLIRGWGAPSLLRDIPHVLTVRVISPPEQRIGAVCRRCGVRAAMARRLIKRWDAAHERSLRDEVVAYSARPHVYDLTLDTGETTVDRCVETLAAAAANADLAETAESRAMLEERMREARLSAIVLALRHAENAALGRQGRALAALFGPKRMLAALSERRKAAMPSSAGADDGPPATEADRSGMAVSARPGRTRRRPRATRTLRPGLST